MTRARVAVIVATLAVVAGAAWWSQSRGSNTTSLALEKGRMTVQWRGRRYFTVASLPARISWCPVTRVGQLEAVSGDTGILITLYERDSLTAGSRPVVAADQSAAAPRPAAAAALRWAPTPDTLVGFRSQSGSVTLRLAGGTASGMITAELHSVVGSDAVSLTGVFDRLPVTTTAAGCT